MLIYSSGVVWTEEYVCIGILANCVALGARASFSKIMVHVYTSSGNL